MALSVDSTLGDILSDEKGKAVLEKHMPGIASHPQLAMAKGMTLKQIAGMSQGQISQATIDAINTDLAAI